MRFRVIDIETTGTAQSEVIEIAAVDVVGGSGGWVASRPRSRLFRPVGGISIHAMAIHHLSLRDLDESLGPPSWEALEAFVMAGPRPDVLVAHNAAFERRHMPPSLARRLPWLCTVQAARRVWPDAPGYANQVLRYWRGLDLDPAFASPAHRAGPDAFVTAHLLMDLIACDASLAATPARQEVALAA
ncbi:MAG TPA: exonuclease domain-containing protein [Caulobacteraceae bacterium]|nr:exonuclease domain-containing protein [Caulobacteraceae bacterium]